METYKKQLEKIKEEYDSNEDKRFYFNLLIMVVVNALLIAIYFKVFRIYFAVNDDTAMSGLMSGIQGFFPGYSVFVNFIPSFIISKLSQVIPQINWFGAYLLITFYLSFVFIGTMLLEKFKLKLGSVLYLAIIACGAIPLLSHFTFTTIAYLAILGGIVFIINAYYSKSKIIKYICYITGSLMLINGSLIRYKSFYSGILLLIGFIIIETIREKKKVLLLCLVSILCCISALGFRAINVYQYEKDPVWNEYLKYNSARANLIDFGTPNYYENEEFYKSIGWSENDYNIFLSYSFPEEEKFSRETLEKIILYKKELGRNIEVKEAIKKLLKTANDNSSISICVLLILIIGSYNICFSKNKLMSLLLMAFPFLMHLGFIFMNRPAYRVIYPHYFITVVLLILISTDYDEIFREDNNTRINDKGTSYILFIIALYMIMYSINPLIEQYKIRKNALYGEQLRSSKEVYDTLCADSNNVYLTSMNYNGDIVKANSILRWYSQGSKNNVISIGGWGTRSKNIQYAKEINGIENLLYDLTTKDNYYFVDKGNHIGMYIIYFEETYNLDVSFEIVNQMYSSNIYKVKIIESTNSNNMQTGIELVN